MNQPTYMIFSVDPSNRQKNNLNNLLKTIKAKGDISEETYRKLYPTGAGHPYSMGSQKSTKKGPL